MRDNDTPDYDDQVNDEFSMDQMNLWLMTNEDNGSEWDSPFHHYLD